MLTFMSVKAKMAIDYQRKLVARKNWLLGKQLLFAQFYLAVLQREAVFRQKQMKIQTF